MGYQYDFWEKPPTENDLLKHEINELKASQDRHRKSFFARLHDMGKAILDCHAEIERLKILIMNKEK